jgi:hypothetical protein
VNATGRKGIRMTKPDELKYPIHVYPTAPRSAAQLAASRRNIVRARAARV